MSNLGTMKSRIADELARSDLASQIAFAIMDAIEAYQPERMFFNESRNITFATVAGTQDYTALTGDVSLVKDIYAIDHVHITIGSTVDELDYIYPEEFDLLSDNGAWTGQPYGYTLYNNTIRLLPEPSDAWTVRIAGHIKKAVPADDGESSNPWMTDAERLIRSRAKYELALHVLRDTELASALASAVTESFDILKGTSNKKVGTGSIRSSG